MLIPVLNESKTISRLVHLLARSPLVLEVVVIDDGSTDDTGRLASRVGASVIMSSLLGKGASMEDGIRAARGDIVLFVDGDLTEIRDTLVDEMTRPIVNNQADMVKASFTRQAGRVTLLTARPLLGAFFPELTRFDQPLGGIVAIRRSLVQSLRLENDYGADVGLLIDAAMRGARIVQVDVGHLDHESQSLTALADMAKQVSRVILDRAWRYDRLSIKSVREMEETERRTRAELLPADTGLTSGRFALFDMDGVLLHGRFVLELADRVGARTELCHFLDNQTLPEEERTRCIASLFAGVSLETFEEIARSLPLVEGAAETVVALRRAGYVVGIITDSYHVAADIVRRRVFADFAVAHVLSFRNRTATGEVTLAPAMLDAHGCPHHHCCKSNVVRRLIGRAGLVPARTLAVGDGDNDVCLLRQVGISVAFRPRSQAVEAAAQHTAFGPLTSVLDLLGSSASLSDTPKISWRRGAVCGLPAFAERIGGSK